MSKTETNKWLGRCGTLLGLAAAVLFAAGCSQMPQNDPRFADIPGLAGTPTATAPATAPAVTPAPAPAPMAATAPTAAPQNGGYRELLEKGDAITITITDLPTPVPEIQDRIKDDGTITLLQNQIFTAAGKTRGELEQEIRKRYVPDFFHSMTVTVKLTEQTRFYFVDGEVKSPNRQVYLSRITVLKAISSAGGFTEFAKKKAVKLTRADGRTFIINWKKAIDDPSLDLEVYPGDKIYVPRSIW